MDKIFGKWIEHTKDLNYIYNIATPFEHIIIENFFNENILKELINKYPIVDDKWYKYWNPIEKKYALNKFEDLPEYLKIYNELQSDEFVKKMSEITGITNLENDPHLHGAGIHFYPSGGKLDMHLDYSIHPISGKERRVNLIIYLNEDWKEEYNGDVQLWNKDFTGPIKRHYPKYNSAIIFRTNDISYHGLPEIIKCPPEMGRKSLAIYYVSDPQPNATPRFKAEFRKLPWQPFNEKLEELYKIRRTRIITKEDLDTIYPNWEEDGKGFW